MFDPTTINTADVEKAIEQLKEIGRHNPDVQKIIDKYDLMSYWADGEHHNLTVVIDLLTKRATRRNQNNVYVKSSAGASMDEAANDRGKGLHPVIKKGFKDKNFKYDQFWSWPCGYGWELLRTFMASKMDPADFKTLGKAVGCAKSICSQALTIKNIQSAFDSVGSITKKGVDKVNRGVTKDPSNPTNIMSANYHFRSLDTEKAVKVIALVPVFGATVTTTDFVPETVFSSKLESIEGADNVELIAPGHKQLNDMAINRQRCLILGAKLMQWRQRRQEGPAVNEDGDDREAAREPVHKKLKKAPKCANPTCKGTAEIDGKIGNCKAPYCKMIFCKDPSCTTMKDQHEGPCKAKALKAKEAKRLANQSKKPK
jgi:hypothetical protein